MSNSSVSYPSTTKGKSVPLRYVSGSVFLLFLVLCAIKIDPGLLRVINRLDETTTLALNHYARKSFLLDYLSANLASNVLCHTAPMVAVLCGLWFRRDRRDDLRARLLMGFCAIVVTALAARSIQMAFPFGGRPIFYPGFVAPIGAGAEGPIRKLSGIVSDSSAYYLGLALLIFFHSRRLGLFAFIAAGLGSVARIYCGYHTLSAIVGGAVLGLGLVAASQTVPVPPVIRGLIRYGVKVERRNPVLFYSVAFFAAYLIATIFIDIRTSFGGI